MGAKWSDSGFEAGSRSIGAHLVRGDSGALAVLDLSGAFARHFSRISAICDSALDLAASRGEQSSKRTAERVCKVDYAALILALAAPGSAETEAAP